MEWRKQSGQFGRTREAEGDGDEEPEGEDGEEGAERDRSRGAGVGDEHVERGQHRKRDARKVG